MPFVGTVPAIKPACASSVTRRVSVLGTEATVAREYTRALIRDYAGDCRVTLVGSKDACRLRRGGACRRAGRRRGDAHAEIAPCFRDDGARTDTVVLACTHYPLLIDRLRQLAPWPVELHRSGAGDRAPRRRSSRPRPFPGAAPGADARAPFSPPAARRHAALAALRRPGRASRRRPARADDCHRISAAHLEFGVVLLVADAARRYAFARWRRRGRGEPP